MQIYKIKVFLQTKKIENASLKIKFSLSYVVHDE